MAAGFPTKNNWIAGDVLTASAMDDLGTTVNYTQYHTPRNVVLNSAFDVWQRGTSFTGFATGTGLADRWFASFDGTGATRTVSQQAFTPGAAPVAGQENQFFCRYAITVAGSAATSNLFYNKIEDVRTFAGQTVTISFWAKADTANSLTPSFTQNFGTGGTPSANVTTAGSAIAITTSWARYTQTFAIPSISGKTIGTTANTSFLHLNFAMPLNATFTFDYFGVQLEKGSYANEYFRNGSTSTAELLACQRFVFGLKSDSTASPSNSICVALMTSTTRGEGQLTFPVTMAGTPTLTAGYTVTNFALAPFGGGAISIASAIAVTRGSSTSINFQVDIVTPTISVGSNVNITTRATAGYVGILDTGL